MLITQAEELLRGHGKPISASKPTTRVQSKPMAMSDKMISSTINAKFSMLFLSLIRRGSLEPRLFDF
jgi:hypothetical protein